MSNELRKFISYFFVGGLSAIVEWVAFGLFNIIFDYALATAIAFFFSTTFNYFLGKKMTFKEYKKSKTDVLSVFFVSGIGLFFNILLMYLFIDICHFKYQMIAKIMATGIVFMWNYISRRLFIYKEKNS